MCVDKKANVLVMALALANTTFVFSAPNTAFAQAIKCDTVTIRKNLPEDDTSETVDWVEFSKQQREISGKALADQHAEVPQSGEELSSGCLLQQDHQAAPQTITDEQLEDLELLDTLLSDNRRDTDEGGKTQESQVSPTSLNNRVSAPEEKQAKNNFFKDNATMVKWVLVTLLAIGLSLLVLLAGRLYRIILGLFLRRRACRIPAQLVSKEGAISGNITIIGLAGCRFVPVNSSELEALERTIDAPGHTGFDLVVADLSHPVNIEHIAAKRAPAYFVKRLKPRQQSAILSHSEIEPTFDQWERVKKDKNKKAPEPKAKGRSKAIIPETT